MRFQDKTVVVTGAASGIGRAAALQFAAEGARVYAADIDETGLAKTAADSNGRSPRCAATFASARISRR
jgi:NAD(P)-dependent dehydrogenase (short-subunit alcohol dehydrogenase family)